MNLGNIINEIAKTDEVFFERISQRRDIFKSFGSKVAIVALPLALGSIFKKAYGQGTPSSVLDILNFALTLEYLEAAFYAKAVAASGLIPSGAPKQAITNIGLHETAHVNFLKTAIQGAGGTPVGSPNFDFTAGGAFADVFTNYATFLAVSQAFEDTGVRAYKGQAGGLKSSNEVLTAALRIHSVEARHASHIRQMRLANSFGNVKPWITGKDTGGIGAAVQPIYDGEETATQANIVITNINGMNISFDAATESFDEPLSADQVLAIVGPFIIS